MVTTYTQSGPVSGAGADLIWAAAIRDETGTFFRNFDANVDALSRRSSTAFRKVGAGGKESASAVGFLAGAVAGVTTHLIGMGLQAIRQFKAVLKSATQVAARAETLAISMRVVGANAGYTAEEMAELEKAMKANGITTIATRQSLLKMAQAQLDLSKSADLARVAQDAAVIAGTNSSVAFNRMIHGITTLNPLVLRNLGIVVNLQEAYKQHAKQMGIENVTTLATNIKQQIALNAVLKAGQRITGTYTAAMGTAGKQAGSLARHKEELMLAIGRLMQPAYLEWIGFMTDTLKEARQWFEENKEEVQDFAQTLGFLIGKVLELTSALIEYGEKVPGLIRKTVPLFRAMEILPDIDERWEMLGITAKRVLTLIAAGLTTIVTMLVETAKQLGAFGTALLRIGRIAATPFWRRGPDWEDALNDAVSGLSDVADGFGDIGAKAREAATKTFLEWSEGLALIDAAAPEAEDAIDSVADSMEALAAETESAIEAISELNEKLAQELAAIAKREMRARIDREIRDARRREDIARSHAENIDKIMRNAAKDRVKLLEELGEEERDILKEHASERESLVKDRNQEFIDIEVEYQRELLRIRESFDEDASELARRNDAVGLARLIRQTRRRLKEAKRSRAEEVTDVHRNYARDLEELKAAQAEQRQVIRDDAVERMQEFEERLEERLAAEDESHQRSLESLARSLAREREDKERHRQWEEDDRLEKHAAEAQELARHLESLQLLDEAALHRLLAQHGEFITEDLMLWDNYYTSRRQREATAYAQKSYVEKPYGGGAGWGDKPTGGPALYEWGLAGGGIGIASSPQRVMIAENEPELIAAIPLSATVNHNVHVDDMSMNIQGVSPQMEQDLMPAVQAMLLQMAGALKAGIGTRRY